MEYDLLVIGAGSGGVRAARIAAGYGKKVALFESDLVGGTCVIRGCVPKKLLVYASSFVKTMKATEAFGWSVPSAQFSWQQLIENKNNEINRLNGIYHKLLSQAGVELIEAHATITGPHSVSANGKIYQAQNILIATGSTPFYPDIEGIGHCISSNEALSLKQFPKKITILGGGYIAVEFAGIFNALGAEVNLVYRGEEILRGFDQDIQSHAQQSFANNGISIYTRNNSKKIVQQSDGRFTTELTDGTLLHDQDQILCATGRVANTQNLGLDSVNLELKSNGQIHVDKDNRTSVASIYAVGDVCNDYNLTPVAIKEGHLLVNRLFKGENLYPEYDFIPTTVFSQPEIATCGYTESEAREQYQEIRVYKSEFRAMKYSMSEVNDKTLMKLIVDEASDQVLGCHIVGADAGEIIQGFAVAIKQGISKQKLDQCVGIHPTSAEELVTMR